MVVPMVAAITARRRCCAASGPADASRSKARVLIALSLPLPPCLLTSPALPGSTRRKYFLPAGAPLCLFWPYAIQGRPDRRQVLLRQHGFQDPGRGAVRSAHELHVRRVRPRHPVFEAGRPDRPRSEPPAKGPPGDAL